jgi:uncharacterized protein (DUF1501 family)
MAITRRVFLRSGALAAGAAAVPAFLARAAVAAVNPGRRTPRLVLILQRGAADGLNIVIPHGEPTYYALRPTIAVPRGEHLELDGFFGMHPAMSSLLPLLHQKHLAIVHAVGSPDATRSHFDAQEYMESGTPGVSGTEDGWLNRCLRGLASHPGRTTVRAVALGPTLPRILSGDQPALALSSIRDFGLADTVLQGTAHEASVALNMLKSVDPPRCAPDRGADYPPGRFADGLRRLAQLFKANLGVQVACAEIGGWDHHVNEGGSQGQLANLLRQFSRSLAAFWTDLGTLAEDTVVATMSEFGRTARENGNGGTGHGRASVMLVLGGGVNGGRVYGRWPGLESSQLHDARDLAVTTDFRHVLGELVLRHLGNKDLRGVFPGFDAQPGNFLNLLA